MDFELAEDQVVVRDLAADVFKRYSDHTHLTKTEAEPDRFDRQLWSDLAAAGVLGVAVPEPYGGAGLSLFEFGPVLIEQGRRVCHVPLWETIVLGALPLARYGTEAQRQHWLPQVASGKAVLTAALEVLGKESSGTATVTAKEADGHWELTGINRAVPAGHVADAVIVPAALESGGTELFLVDPSAPGVTRTVYERTDRGLGVDLSLAGAAAERLDDGPDDDRMAWSLTRAWAGLAAIQLGVSQEAVRQAADYLTQRHQFGVPLATFQAVAHQVADCHSENEAMEVTLWNALWRLHTGRPAVAAAHTAKWWAAEAGDRVARTVQHLHGGIGADITYPVHRYMLWTSQLANTLGPASWHLHHIGLLIAGGTA